MKYLNLSKLVASVAISALMFSSCDKVETLEPVGDKGSTFVKILNAGTPAVVDAKSGKINFVTTSQKFLAVDLRRDPANEADLNKTMTVVVKDDIAAVAAADPSYVNLPAAWYTLESEAPRVGGSGGTYTFTFKPGEFAKTIYVVVPNAQLLDPATVYAIGFTIQSVDAGGKISDQKSLIIEVGAKNAYDGIYKVTGEFIGHPTYAGTFGTAADHGLLEVAMVTTGSNTCKREGVTPDAEIGGYDGFIFFVNAANGGPAYSGFSNVYPSYVINPATNVVTVVPLAGSANSVTWNNYGSTYSPGAKSFDIKSGYNGTRFINETWVYQRSR